jgi:hypothetical protein
VARSRYSYRVLGIVLVGAQLLARRGWSDGPAEQTRRAVVLARVISYEEDLKERVGTSVGLLVLFKAGNAASQNEALGLVEAARKLSNVRIEGLPFYVSGFPFGHVATLDAAVSSKGYDALYVCVGLESQMDAIKQVARKRQVITMAGSTALMKLGASVAVEAGDQTRIFIHLTESHGEGITFAPPLLRVATVVR